MIALLLFALLLVSCSWWWYVNPKSKKNLAPGPLAIPLLGHLHLLGKNPHRSLSNLSKIYGPIMSIKLGMVPTLVINSPDAARAILSTHDIVFASRPKLAAAKHISYSYRDMLWSDYGSYWRIIRKVCTVKLLTAKRIGETKELREDEISRLIGIIAQEGRKGDVPVDMNSKLSMANLNMVSLMAYSRRVEDFAFVEMMQEAIDLVGSFTPGDYFPFLKWMDDFGSVRKMRVVQKKLDRIFQQILDEHMSRSKNVQDLVDELISLDEIEDDDRKALIMDIFAAGTDTSSITTEWALSELIKNPSCLIKAQQEIDQVVGMNRAVTEEDLSNLSYLRAAIKETFRLHPALPLLVPHVSTEDCIVDGIFVPAGTRVSVNVWSIGRDPRWWESPEVFNPERFLGSSVEVKGQHFELLPFGSGRRMCPGINLAIVTVEIMVARLIQAFDWTVPEEDLDMEDEFGITLRKKIPLRALAKPR